MKTLTKLALTLIAVAGLQACDPYEDENKGTPVVINAIATDGSNALEGTTDGTAWTLAGATAAPVRAPDEQTAGTVIFIKTNKLLDGASIQTTPDVCSPTNDWLSVNGVTATGWSTCYSPGSPSAAEGASIVVYPGPSITDNDSWFSLTDLAPGIFNLGGTVSDKQGHPLEINVNVFVVKLTTKSDTAGTELTVTFSDAGVNMTGVQLWETTADVDGNPVEADWAPVATTSPFVHGGLTPDTTLWYKLTASTNGYPAGTPVDYEMANPVSGTTATP